VEFQVVHQVATTEMPIAVHYSKSKLLGRVQNSE
jgi:hypothetical protein